MDQQFHQHLQEITCNYIVFSLCVQRPQRQSTIQNLKHKHGRVKTMFFSLFVVFYLLAKNLLHFPGSFSDLSQSKWQYYIWFQATQLNTPKYFLQKPKKHGGVLSPMVYTPESDAMCSKTLTLPTVFFLGSVKIKKIHFRFGKFNK